MSSGIAFESSRLKEVKRQEKRDARQKVLDEAKKQHEKEQYKKEQAKLRGEDKWMLPALSERIDKEQQELKRKSKKEKKKKKKHKKEKKQKKHVSSSDSSDDDEDESSDKDSVWIEKMDDRSTPSEQTLIKGPRLQRDSWMEAPLDLIPLTSRQEIRNKEKQNLEGEQKKNPVEQLGQHERELNPYWKDGGTGLPEEYVEKAEKPSAQLNIGDGGLSWMKKAYQRCVEQAKEENRTLEDVAIEKYGSLKKLEDKLAEAEDAYMKVQKNRTEGANKYDRGKRNDSGRSRMFMKPSDDDSKSRIDSKDRYRDRKRSRSRERRARSRSRSPYRRERNRRSRSNDRYNISRSRSRERRKNLRSRSRSADRSRYSRSRSKERGRSHRSKESNRRRSRSRSYDRHDRSSAAELSSSKDCVNSKINDSQSFASRSSALKSRFMKPGEIARNSNYGEDRYTPKSRDTVPAWKKKEFMKPKEEPTSKDSKTEHNRSEVQSESKRRKPMPDTSESSSSSQSEDSGSESEQSDHKDDQNSKEEEILILSEQEMNQLGAKIVRAEIMGDNELAGKLKQQLEKARENNEKYKQDAAAATGGAHSATKESENVVVLTRTNKKGMVIPLSEARHQREKGRKRKKTKVQTHSDQGERQRYFADDDKFDLKQMVEREKMGTAEDQNMMFARLAGRSMEKADEDYQMDDVIVSRASMAKSEAKMEERDRAHAIFEHRKMSAALEKCNFCFENVPKHLIIAIGMKVYLCLPNHKSLTDGHCLIVPMQHVAAGTAVDEDVWTEIQVFRKGITKMFETMDQDVVFMETCMGLRSHPHMHLECIPLPKETGEMAPIYFKKAILECDTEWAQNKKLVDLSKKDVRRSIPKGFPYFAVDFGLQGGFAHAIEDEQKFPRYFGKEVVGGMVDAEPRLWRKPQKENFDDQRKKVLEFAEWWKPYDWTQRLHQDDT